MVLVRHYSLFRPQKRKKETPKETPEGPQQVTLNLSDKDYHIWKMWYGNIYVVDSCMTITTIVMPWQNS